MERRINERGFEEHFVKGRHLKLVDLKLEAERFGLRNQYLFKENIPNSPRAEFHVSFLKHDTDQTGLRGIRRDEGFRNPRGKSLVWWSLKVGPEEVESAEKRLLDQTYPDRTEEQESFLKKFTTSPVFTETSRLGAYRFTFPLKEVLQAYKQQVCSGSEPILRVYETVLYKQEVMHVVLVHGPANQELYAEYPLLTDDPNAICVFRDGQFIWRPEAMSETHRHELIQRDAEMRMEAQVSGGRHEFYVWDNVSVALHMEEEQVLKFDVDQLRNNLKFVTKDEVTTNRNPFDSFEEAKTLVKELWPEHDIPLEEPQTS
ncbi:uncharacterized protein LOC121634011 [Melanotaenia boesemani]|uniref:uncharacterized protein LOC121634011 n=1 Tax=Melanotaenia boesemani TaxID=1250792 RepID=UPI001C050AAA|nr:uncharacterized protein LOC121634011 [Melanotaenia boesemani]XP_041832341.1 uncharacterized protein LOC121634011 [Melanotaenia boesemani]